MSEEQFHGGPDEAAQARGGPSEVPREGGVEEPTRDQVLEALRNVYDPELGINIVDLGLVYDVYIQDGLVDITYTLTTMGCPIGPLIEHMIQQALATVPGVKQVHAELALRPPWSPDMMSEEARAALGFF